MYSRIGAALTPRTHPCADQKLNRQSRLNFWLEVLNNFITNYPDILVDLGRKTDLFYEHLENTDPLLFKTIELSKKI